MRLELSINYGVRVCNDARVCLRTKECKRESTDSSAGRVRACLCPSGELGMRALAMGQPVNELTNWLPRLQKDVQAVAI